MPALFVFLLKVNIALLLFCAGYYLVLRHLTFYTLNRIYLVIAILFATVYPKINLNSFAQQHQQLARPVQVVLNLEAPVQTLIKPLAQPDYWYWAEVVFWMGAALLALRLLMQMYSLYRLYRQSTPANIQNHRVRLIDGDAGPFSFWQSIYVNPANHNEADLKAILQHEQVHVNEWHTLDVLLAELSTIFYWFNPGIWLMKKAVRENIEFITDRKILQNGIDSKQYQYSMVSVVFAASPLKIVNHFNMSTIKKRIIMMNAKRSSRVNLTRYILLTPAVVALLLVFSVSKAEFKKAEKGSVHLLKAFKNVVSKIEFPFMTSRPTKITLPLRRSTTLDIEQDTLIAARTLINTDTAKRFDYKKILDRYPNAQIYLNGVKSSLKALEKLDQKKITGMASYPSGSNSLAEFNDGLLLIVSKENYDADTMKALIAKLNSTQPGKLQVRMDTSGVGIIDPIAPHKTLPIERIKINGVTYSASGDKVLPAVTIVEMGKALPQNISRELLSHKINDGDSVHSVLVQDGNKLSITFVNGKSQKDSLLGAMAGYTIHADGTIAKKGAASSVVGSKKRDSVVRVYNLTAAADVDQALLARYGKVIKVTTVPRNAGPINFADKLIMIDGKEATTKELRKLSADKIESVATLNTVDAKAKYGDKGEKGAILITTKK